MNEEMMLDIAKCESCGKRGEYMEGNPYTLKGYRASCGHYVCLDCNYEKICGACQIQP